MNVAIPLSKSKTQYFINQAYIEYVRKADMFPVLIAEDTEEPAIMGTVDALLLPGGIDLDPIYYGEDNDVACVVSPEKDAFERMLLYSAIERGLPIFGICRGMQLIVQEYMTMLEGSGKSTRNFMFCQHIASHSQTDSPINLGRKVLSHFVECDRSLYIDSKAELAGSTKTDSLSIPVNSMHHQGLVSLLGPTDNLEGMEIMAWTRRGLNAKTFGQEAVVVEAIKIDDWRVLAVQWHPEELGDTRLLCGLNNEYKVNNYAQG